MHRLFPSLLGRIKTWKAPYVIQPAIRLENKVQKGKLKKIATAKFRATERSYICQHFKSKQRQEAEQVSISSSPDVNQHHLKPQKIFCAKIQDFKLGFEQHKLLLRTRRKKLSDLRFLSPPKHKQVVLCLPQSSQWSWWTWRCQVMFSHLLLNTGINLAALFPAAW